MSHEGKTEKKSLKKHNFLVCACNSQDFAATQENFAQNQENFARSHNRATVTFRNSGLKHYLAKIKM